MIENNRSDYEKEREARERRLRAYAEEIQKQILGSSDEIVHQLVEERHNQGLTQSDMVELTGMMASNIARFENGGRVPTLLVLQKYAGALGKHIELKVCDNMEQKFISMTLPFFELINKYFIDTLYYRTVPLFSGSWKEIE